MSEIRYLWLILVLLFASQTLGAVEDTDVEFNESYTRENPEIDAVDSNAVDTVNLAAYPFLNLDANRIFLNGMDWSGVETALKNTDADAFRLVHIGDSHVQADMATGYTRKLMQQDFGSAGRGLIVPLRLAGTNEPFDYSIRSTSNFDSEKLLANPWKSSMGFTGVSLKPNSPDFDFTVRADDAFERLYIYYSGATINVNAVKCGNDNLVYAIYEEPGCLEIGLPFPCDEVTLDLSSLRKDVYIYGIELVSDLVGVVYHAIGINGATYSAYNRLSDLGQSIGRLEPQLIILSLGTNEAFGRFNRTEFLKEVDAMVSRLQESNPGAAILLVTPSECQRRVKVRRKSSYSVNDKVAEVRDAILQYGRDNHVAVYDWYQVAGGHGSSQKWISAKLFSRDRIHYSRQGYLVAGRLIYDGLLNTLLINPHD